MSDCPPGCRVNFNILNFIFVLNYAYLSSWLFIVVNVGWRYVRSKGRFGLTHVLFRKKTYFQCCSWIFWGYDDFERKLVFLFCHWLFQEGGNSSESSFALFYGKFRTCAPRVKVSHCIELYFYCWKGDIVNLFIPNFSLVILLTACLNWF